jgi:transposase
VIIPAGATKVPAAVRDALEDGDNELPTSLRQALDVQRQRLAHLSLEMAAIEQRLEEFATRDVAVQRYRTVPGVGLLTATALRASAGDLSRFRSGRQFSAWLGLTPREHSSGQQRRLGRLTKRGDAYLRTLFTHGARAVLQAARMKQRRGQSLDPLQTWALSVQQRQGHNKATCALANKLARRLWAMAHHGNAFNPYHFSQRPVAA